MHTILKSEAVNLSGMAGFKPVDNSGESAGCIYNYIADKHTLVRIRCRVGAACE